MTKELSKKQQIEICNAINTAVANGKRVCVGKIGQYGSPRIMGAFPRYSTVCLVQHVDSLTDVVSTLWLGDIPVRSFIPTESDVEIIYEPPR